MFLTECDQCKGETLTKYKTFQEIHWKSEIACNEVCARLLLSESCKPPKKRVFWKACKCSDPGIIKELVYLEKLSSGDVLTSEPTLALCLKCENK